MSHQWFSQQDNSSAPPLPPRPPGYEGYTAPSRPEASEPPPPPLPPRPRLSYGEYPAQNPGPVQPTHQVQYGYNAPGTSYPTSYPAAQAPVPAPAFPPPPPSPNLTQGHRYPPSPRPTSHYPPSPQGYPSQTAQAPNATVHNGGQYGYDVPSLYPAPPTTAFPPPPPSPNRVQTHGYPSSPQPSSYHSAPTPAYTSPTPSSPNHTSPNTATHTPYASCQEYITTLFPNGHIPPPPPRPTPRQEPAVQHAQQPSSSSNPPPGYNPPSAVPEVTITEATQALEKELERVTLSSPAQDTEAAQPRTTYQAPIHPPTDRKDDTPSTSGNSTRTPSYSSPVKEGETPTHSRGLESAAPASKPPPPPGTVVSCINSPVEFPTTWYTHSATVGVHICSRCHYDHILGTRFEGAFINAFTDDHQPRVCRFSKPRVKDHLWKEALASASLGPFLQAMTHRASIPDCKGIGGANGTEGIKWYKPVRNSVPGMVICEACHEDWVLCNSFAPNFERAEGQGPTDVWACDLTLRYINNELKVRGRAGDWEGFVRESAARLTIPACPSQGTAKAALRKWFTPTIRNYAADGILICSGCYCDHVLHSGEEAKWKDAGDSVGSTFGSTLRCAVGQLNYSIAMGMAQEAKDFSIFWRALEGASREEFCSTKGVKDGKWFTFPSDPAGFGVCGACRATVLEPLGLTRFLVSKRGIPKGETIICSINPGAPRFLLYAKYLIEAHLRQDISSLQKFAAEWAHIPICRRDEDFRNGIWYGWSDCAICPECHHTFTRGTALEGSMPIKGVRMADSNICQMYSPRMRALYTAACAKNPPDPRELLAYADHRSTVYVQTVMRIRQMLVESQLMLGQQTMLNTSSSLYMSMGQMQEISMSSPYTYGMAGVGYGFANQNALQGAIYGQQAMAAGQQAANPNRTLLVGELERQWRAVE